MPRRSRSTIRRAHGEIGLKDALTDTRRHLEASRGHLSSAHQHLLQLLRDRPDDGADDANEELSMTASVRKARLDDLDRGGGGVRKVIGAGPRGAGRNRRRGRDEPLPRAKEIARLRSALAVTSRGLQEMRRRRFRIRVGGWRDLSQRRGCRRDDQTRRVAGGLDRPGGRIR